MGIEALATSHHGMAGMTGIPLVATTLPKVWRTAHVGRSGPYLKAESVKCRGGLGNNAYEKAKVPNIPSELPIRPG